MDNTIFFSNNNNLKTKFLDEIEKKSISQFNLTRNVLVKIDKMETMKNKNIYEFDTVEIKEFLKQLDSTSISTLNTYYSTINKYIRFIEETNSEVVINKDVTKLSSRDMEDLLNKEAHEERYITREDLFRLVSNAVNPQDKALFLLLFEGVRGKDYNDLRLLEERNVNFENNTIITPQKTITIKDKRTMFILKSAIKQTEYYYERLNKDTNEMEMAEYEINPNNYFVIKRVMYKNLGLEPYVSNRIKTKIQKFAKEMGRPALTGNTIYNSGLAERFLEHFNYRSTETISTIEIQEYLREHNENIAPATLRRIANYILGN